MALMQRSLQVAGVSGDVRRVLQLSRKAAEICEEEKCQQARLLVAVERSLAKTSQFCVPGYRQADPTLWQGSRCPTAGGLLSVLASYRPVQARGVSRLQ